HEFVEPYEGAGYCVCDDCQKERPLLRDMLALLAPQEASAYAFRCESCEQHIGRDEEYFVAPDGVRVHKRCCVVTPAAPQEAREPEVLTVEKPMTLSYPCGCVATYRLSET